MYYFAGVLGSFKNVAFASEVPAMARANRRDVLADQDVQVVHCIIRSININRSINKANKHVVGGMAPFWRSFWQIGCRAPGLL